MSGYGVDPGTLASVAAKLGQASDDLDAGVAGAVTAVDAGKSSDAVATALRLVGQAAVLLAHHLDDMAAKIDHGDASYADIENNAAGEVIYAETWAEPSKDSGPLVDAANKPEHLPVQRPR